MSNDTDRRQFLTIAMAAGDPVAATLLVSQQTEPNLPATKMAYLSLDSLYATSLSATLLTGEAADRIAIRELVDAWAHCADRRFFEKQAALFTQDGLCFVYGGDPATYPAIGTLRGHAELLAALPVLNKFTATTHFNGQSVSVVDRGFSASARRRKADLTTLSIRLLNKFIREGRLWLFQSENSSRSGAIRGRRWLKLRVQRSA
jgi:hypothetical protein